MESVTIGTNKDLNYASDNVSTTNPLPTQVGKPAFDIDLDDKQAEIAIDAAIAGIGHHGWAMAWTTFEVDGDSPAFARVNINNIDYRMWVSAMGIATARANVSIFLEDITNDDSLQKMDDNDRVDEFHLKDIEAAVVNIIPKTASDRLTKEVTGDLKSGHRYRAGVRADVWATADSLASSTADVHTGGTHEGYIRYDNISVTWP